MAEKKHRTQILLEPEQHKTLAEIARRERRTISDVVREMLREQLERRRKELGGDTRPRSEQEIERQLQVLERIREHHEAILARRGGKPLDFDVVEEINRAREERTEEILGVRPRDLP